MQVIFVAAMFACAVWSIARFVARVRKLAAVLPVCAATPAQVVAAILRREKEGPRVTLPIEYLHEGQAQRVAQTFPKDAAELVGMFPEMLVNPRAPGEAYVKELYS